MRETWRSSMSRPIDSLLTLVRTPTGAGQHGGRRHRGILTIGISAALTTLIVAAGVLAAAGDLTPQECIDDNGAADACALSTEGLDQAHAVAISPDGKSVYVASNEDDAIVRFDRNLTTGALTPQGCIEDGKASTCAQSAVGLKTPNSVAVSADGKSVYVASAEGEAIVRFDRDPTTGALTPQGCIDDNDGNPEDSCAQSVDGLELAGGVAVSPDGESVYVTAVADDAIVRFDRDPTTGALTPQGCIEDNGGPDDCAQSVEGLDGARGVAVSQDGKSVYTASQNDDAIVRFDRDPTTGALTVQGCIDDNDGGIQGEGSCAQSADGLFGATSVTVSPDGISVYSGAPNQGAVARFDRDQTTGALTPQGCIDDNDTGADECTQTADGLDAAGPVANGIAVSPDGTSVYVGGSGDDAVVHLIRSTVDGAIAPAGCVDDNDSGPESCAQSTDGLDGATAVAVSPDGKSLYVTGNGDDSIVRFNRALASSQITELGPARGWIGLKNSDDQGTRFDLMVELLKNGAPVASGLERCISGVTRNPSRAIEAIVSWDAFAPVPVSSGDTLSLRLSTRIGTNPDASKCAGHSNAVGLRLYYHSATRPSAFDATIEPDQSQTLYLRSDGSPCGNGDSAGVSSRILDSTAPSGPSPKCKDSAAVKFSNGNAWKEIGTWSLAPLP